MTKEYKNEVDDGKIYLWYQYSKMCSVHNFDISFYKKMNIKNPFYVYDKRGVLMGIICGETEEEAIKLVKRYIIRKIFLNLLKGGDDKNFDRQQKAELRREEWENLMNYLKKKFGKK